MRLNTDPPAPPGLPCWRDLHRLTTAPGALLPAPLVMLASLKQLARRCREIAATHPQYQEEAPLVLAHETRRRRLLSGELTVTVNRLQVA